MKATTKRLVGILLALAMVLAMLPMAVFAETATTIYLQPNDNWKMDGARFAAVIANSDWSSQMWVDLADSDGDGLYELEIPQNGVDYAIVIFCRMNPGTTENNWNNKWNQSDNLNIPTDNKVVYVVDGWDKSGQWIEMGGEIVEQEKVYYLRGTMNGWGTTDALTNNGDGTYSITVDLAAGTYQYRIADTGWGEGWPAGNADLTVYSDCAVTFVLNTADGSIEVTGDGLTGEPLPEPEYNYYVAGSEELCGVAWDPAAEENMMTLNEETGLYEIVLSVWYAGTYEYKVTTGSWETPSYGPAEGGNYSVEVYVPGEVTITFNPETTEVTCDVYQFGEGEVKFQFKADASASDATVDLRMITSVDNLDYAEVNFFAIIDGVRSEPMKCTTVYESIQANGTALTCEDIFGSEGYLVTYTLENIPAEYYDKVIEVYAAYTELDGNEIGTNHRTIVIADAL